ncbi:MAG: hypothetical protein EA394_04920 [Bacteroidia bacterium]|nr:MAG: hypothetical protein EA394_04920 [Bacteroidia bacterium]
MSNRMKKKEKPKRNARPNALGRFFLQLLDGSVLANNKAGSAMPFILFLGGLALMLIFNTYYAEKKARETEQLRKEMTELRIRYIQTKSEYMFLTQQSEIARRLRNRGFIESTEPPVAVFDNHSDTNFFVRLFGQNRPSRSKQ